MDRLDENLYPLGKEAGVLTKAEPFGMQESTPVEYYKNHDVFVKREDMCCNIERFSKARGFWLELQNAKEHGQTEIGWEEAGDYRAAKCVAAICQALRLQLFIWGKPIEKLPNEVQAIAKHRIAQIEGYYGAKVIWYDRKYLVKIHWYQHRKEVEYMIPLGGDKSFMRYAIAKEAERTCLEYPEIEVCKDIVVCVSTGGLLLGLLDGLHFSDYKIHAILIQDRKPIKIPEQLKSRVKFHDMGWKYYDLSDVYPEEFPCNLQYDAKAWKWLKENRDKLGKHVLFWNAGA